MDPVSAVGALGDDDDEKPEEPRVDEYEMTEEIRRLLPYDGPHSGETVAAAAAALPPLVRYLNNATRSPAGLPYAATVDRVVAGLESVAMGLDQLLGQLVEHTERHAADPTLYDDRHGREGRQTALRAAESLTQARGAADVLSAKLQAVRALTAHLGSAPHD